MPLTWILLCEHINHRDGADEFSSVYPDNGSHHPLYKGPGNAEGVAT